ncbi:sigma 54-interacting transcriptional regulator [Brevibacillus humidisoli]|uniref:sigma-54 interaction domain-containing protein n=1 Tax=Brevibacillus humidisoli TaxID=2895522 RepID=UPI001E442E05|nr:sigma 54-interacting transcriptional regulator [Brevibacillus humidisoli]UFJ39957.1 sigma 54-interacting transcriptional regulator [Brevibacillus humidisoli]
MGGQPLHAAAIGAANNAGELEWLNAVIDSINDGILVIDSQEIVRLINPEYTRITGVSPEQIIGKPLRRVRPGALLPETLRDGRGRVGIYRKEGRHEYVVDMAPIVVNGVIIGAVSVCKGLTEVHKLTQELHRSRETISRLEQRMDSLHQAAYRFHQIVGKDGGLRRLVQLAQKAAESDLPVLITGESGTGKELFAQSIHNESGRAGRPFVPVNCAAIPADLLESELFGYEAGSFTNAKKSGKVGLFEVADHGTLFLDEIGDMSLDLQAKLLRVLQEQKIRRIGDTRERSINVRIVAATNKDLQHLVAKGNFREDLLYRLQVIRLHIPPLRERREDIIDLIDWMVKGTSCRLEERTMQVLQQYDWPGNVRELKNAIDYAVCMADGSEISVESLPQWIVKRVPADDQPKRQVTKLKEVLEEAERGAIQVAIEQYGSDVEGKKKAAQALGISLATLYNKINRLQVDW